MQFLLPAEGSGVLPYMGYIGMCHCKEKGFQVAESGIGYRNHKVQNRVAKVPLNMIW